MAYSGSGISTGRINEDRGRVTNNLGRIFGDSPTERMLNERSLPVSPMDRDLLEGEVEDV